MDKKNTMLLTVIAVATLLVAVVGATFAYFTASNTNSTTNTTTTVTTEQVGTVTLSGGETLGIELSAADMAETAKGTTYYATDAGSGRNTAPTSYDIATATVSGGASGTAYNCTFTLTATVAGDMADSLSEGDASLVLSGATTQTLDLATDFTTKSWSTTVTMNGLTTTNKVSGYVSFTNRNANQDTLQNKTLTVTLASTDFNCTVAGA